MQMSAPGIARLKGLEGWRPVVYRDEGGRETVGYGHLLTAEDRAMQRFAAPLTAEQGAQLLHEDLAPLERGVFDLLKRPLAQHQFDALVCFAFNVGLAALRTSHLLYRVNADSAAVMIEAEWMRWCRVRKAGAMVVSEGLLKRRAAELRMWRGPGA